MEFRKRDVSIDILRGISVVIMLGANALGYVTPSEAHPLWFHFYASLAAPLFILLSSYMICENASQGKHTLPYYLLRGGMILLTGAFIDVVFWQSFPFTSFDVLYLIGFTTPILYLIVKLKLRYRYAIIIIVFIIQILLVNNIQYDILEVNLFAPNIKSNPAEFFLNILKAWLYDGWFPVFPWLAWAIAGTIVAHYRHISGSLANRKAVIIGTVSTIVGFIALAFFLTENTLFDLVKSNDHYDELFYPAMPYFFVWCIGIILLLFALVDKIQKNRFLNCFAIFGQASLFIYIFHTFIIANIFTYLFDADKELIVGWIASVLLVIISFATSFVIYLLKKKRKSKNFFVNFFFGG
jgi:uncharacterized membrane protein